MSQAIITKFISATNTRGARIKATAQAGSIIVRHSNNGDVGHIQAAQALIEKLGWPEAASAWAMGAMPNNSGFAFVKGE